MTRLALASKDTLVGICKNRSFRLVAINLVDRRHNIFDIALYDKVLLSMMCRYSVVGFD